MASVPHSAWSHRPPCAPRNASPPSALLRRLCALGVRSLLPSILLCACAAPKPIDPGPIPRTRVPIQFGVGGSEVEVFSMADAWPRVSAIFTPPARSAPDERRAIREAIALFEQVAGEQTPTHVDKKQGENPLGQRGQLDCVDESSNTTTYLWMLFHDGFLRFHDVDAPRWRTRFLWFAPHRTATIRERATGRLWAVDSWVRDNGAPPDVQPIEAWRRLETPEPE